MLNFLLAFQLVTAHFNLPPGLLQSLCYVESSHKVRAISIKDGNSDSLGVCQIKLSTARDLGFKGSVKNLMIPKVNVYYAGKYLKRQITRYRSVKKGIVAYNIGHFDPEATRYLNKVLKAYAERR